VNHPQDARATFNSDTTSASKIIDF